jgi:thiamine kinase-like enzyme
MTSSAPTDARLERALEAVPGWSGARSVRTSPMPGGITNHNFLVEIDGEQFVARLAGEDTALLGIDREAERAAAEAAYAVGIGPEVVAFLPELGCLVTRFIEARPIPPEAMRDEVMLARVVPAIRAFHQEAAPLPSKFSPFRMVEAYRGAAVARGVRIPEAHDELEERAREIRAAFAASPVPPLPCHNDLLNANFLLAGDRVFIVDYEYAGMGDRFFDLGNLATKHDFEDPHDDALLECYFGRVTAPRLARLKLMKVMADFWEAMWGVLQQGISTLDFDYVEYADVNFERARRHACDPRYRQWLRAAADTPPP